MPRGGNEYLITAVEDEVSPVLLLRIIDVPKNNSPSEKTSWYFCNIRPEKETYEKWTFEEDEAYIEWVDEKGAPAKYYSIGFTYSGTERSTDSKIDTTTVSVDNVDMRWAAVANQFGLNNSRVEIWRAFRDNLSMNEDVAQIVFAGHIKSALISDTSIQISVSPDFSLRKPAPRRMYWPSDFPYLPSSKSVSNPLIKE